MTTYLNCLTLSDINLITEFVSDYNHYRMFFNKEKSFHDYLTDDILKIVNHWKNKPVNSTYSYQCYQQDIKHLRQLKFVKKHTADYCIQY